MQKYKKIFGRLTIGLFMFLLSGIFFFSAALTCQAAKVSKVKKAEAESKTYTSVAVTWKPVKNITGYEVYRSTNAKGKYKKIKTVKKDQKLEVVDKKLTTGKTYYYKICAYKKSGSKTVRGAYSNIAAAAPVPAATTVKTIKSVGYNALEVSWKSVAGASGYMVYKSVKQTGGYSLAATIPGKNKVKTKITGLTCGRNYYFQVVPYKNVQGKKVVGIPSDKKQGYSVPEAVEIANVSLETASSATLKWMFTSGADGYYVYRSSMKDSGYKQIGSVNVKSTKTFTDSNVEKGKTYYYKVAAYHKYNNKKVKGKVSQPIELRAVNSYKVSPSSKPYADNYIKNQNYNSRTKTYYMLLSYMELLERIGGGEIVFTKGTYNFWKPIYVPSNTTIRFEDGVKIKSIESGSSNSLFVLANPTDMKNSKKYTKYSGVHDIKLIGTGTVIFDKEYKNNSAILIGHTYNVNVSGITFKNISGSAHFIELDASRNVVVENCVFTGFKETGKYKEAINIDVPDRLTQGFSGTYSSMDKTPNDMVTIKNNVFDNLPAAVGSHMYTAGAVHTNIKITNNTIKNCKYYGIRIMNWKNSSVTGNKISNITGNTDADEGESLAIEVRGGTNINISGNVVSDSDRFMLIKVANYSSNNIKEHPGIEKYGVVYNRIDKDSVVHNTLHNIKCEEDIYYSNRVDFKDKEIWSVEP